MRNYKVRVSNESESKEVQELFFELGYHWSDNVKSPKYLEYPVITSYEKNHELCYGISLDEFHYHQSKELTIPQLRDLVVLHRNDVGDATHTIDTSSCKYFVSSEDKVFLFDDKENSWVEIEYYSCDLNPITKEKIPYLVKTIDKWEEQQLTSDTPESATCLKIPDLAIKAYLNYGWTINFVNSDDDFMNAATHGSWVSTHRGRHSNNTRGLVWQRQPKTMPTHPEELPFIDDEPKHDDNVNHPSHYTQGSIECIEALEAATVNKQGIEAVCVSNIIKYLWRYESKNGLEDVKKAQWYLQKLVDKLEQNNG